METSIPDYLPVYSEELAENIEDEFHLLKDECYLDHAGATLYSKTQIKNVLEELSTNLYGNPHSLGSASKFTSDIIDQMRFRILDHFHTNSDEYSVIFTSSATSSLKLIADTFQFNSKETTPNEVDGCFVYTQDNHTSVLGMREVVSRRGAEVACLGHDVAFELLEKTTGSDGIGEISEKFANSLFVYPAQCNFSGLKYPLSWIERVRNGALDALAKVRRSNWFVLLDAAGFVGTNDLDLSVHRPDFVCVSFYKMFGYPTGIGALLVRNLSQFVLEKLYYGGGTVQISLSSEMFHVKRSMLHERFEDGTLPFLSIISLRHGFDALNKITSRSIEKHVFTLARYLHHSLLKLHHSNGRPIAILYSDTDYEDPSLQGGIVAFNLLRSNGENIGFVEFSNMANLHKIHVRTGCFCNPGACQRHLKLSNKELKLHFNAGHVCGDERDLIDGRLTGAVRISFGYMSTINDADAVIRMITKCFLDRPEITKIPDWWTDYRQKLHDKYGNNKIRDSDKSNEKIIGGNNSYNENIYRPLDVCQTNGTDYDVKRNADNRKLSYLKHIFIYPVKSCGCYQVTEPWILGSKGLLYDREWMVTTSSGVCLTQKQEVKLCLVTPRIDCKNKILELNYPGMPSMQVPLNVTADNVSIGTICRSKICGHKVEGIDCGSDVSEWLSLALGRPGLRLVKQNDQNVISSNTPVKKGPELSFSSQAQYLLINEASIRWLVDKLPTNSECDNDSILPRFRGNIIIDGCEAFAEMKWNRVGIGKIEFEVNGPCTRCQMICIDQTTGEKTAEPLRTIAQEFHGKMRFGVYLSRSNTKDTMINIGDQIWFQREV